MSPWEFRLFSALIFYLVVAAAAGEPSCENVPDFGRCSGNTDNFCPRDVECSCKNGYAFCSCPYYKGPNKDYWYMGAKCDQLWSSLDVLVIAVFPGVALAFVVAVTAQLIHYCKTKSKSKGQKEPKNKSERRTTNAHQNQTFVSETDPRSPYVDLPLANVREQAPQRMQAAPQRMQAAPWSAAAAEPQNKRKLNYYSDAAPADNRSSNYFDPQSLPAQDYDMDDQRGPQQFSRFAMPANPQADYAQINRQPTSPNAGWETDPSLSDAHSLKTSTIIKPVTMFLQLVTCTLCCVLLPRFASSRPPAHIREL